MFSINNLQSWVENGPVEQWFKWVEWVGLTSALFVAVTYCKDGWSAGLVFSLATASMIQCYLVSVVWLLKPLIAGANRLSSWQSGPTHSPWTGICGLICRFRVHNCRHYQSHIGRTRAGCGVTINPIRSRFAARLVSGVRHTPRKLEAA